MTIAHLYEPLIERDLSAIPAAVRTFRQSNSSDDLFLAVARFAVLAFAPSQHSKHALLATLAARDLRDDYGDRWDDLLSECARYVAESRQPGSEPPIPGPPAIDADQPRGIEALRAAVVTRDRLAGERWLAARLDDDDLLHDLLVVATDDLEDLGDKLIVTTAAWKLAGILGEKGRYAALRVAMWEIISYGNVIPSREDGNVIPSREDGEESGRGLYDQLVQNTLAEKGSLESMHEVFLYHAAKDTPVFARVCNYLASQPLRSSAIDLPRVGAPPIYRLARDYGQCLKAFALRDQRVAAAAAYNLEHGPSFADWSFA
ncbi:MAG: hypothetical protein ACXW29_09445 [Thermoanaerobaculia bacterium]